MIMCRDLKFDDVKDFVNMKGSSFDVLAAVAARGKEILEQHLLAMDQTKKGKRKELLQVEEHLHAMDQTKRVKRSYDGGETSISTSPPKKKIKFIINLNLRPPLPEILDKLIREMARGKNLTPPTLVIQKRLFDTDLSRGHNRLSIPIRLIRDDFLTEEEKRYVRGHDVVTGKKRFMAVTMIEPSLATETVKFSQWDMAKSNGGRTSSTYVIYGSWHDIAKRNKLKSKMEVQIWCFRLDRDLCFALVRPPMISF